MLVLGTGGLANIKQMKEIAQLTDTMSTGLLQTMYEQPPILRGLFSSICHTCTYADQQYKDIFIRSAKCLPDRRTVPIVLICRVRKSDHSTSL